MFLRHGWDPKGNSYTSPLESAIENGDLESVMLLFNAEKLNSVDLPNQAPRLNHDR